MRLAEIQSLDKWKELEKDIYERSGLDTYVYDTRGMSITDFKKWANRLCPAIKATDKGLAFICAVANQNLANEAKRTKAPVIGECDAGLLKVAVPIFVGDEFLGVAGGCGLILNGSEVESFLVNKMTDIGEDEIEHLSHDIKKMTIHEVKSLIDHIQGQINRIVRDLDHKAL